jgi:hypothetical protein
MNLRYRAKVKAEATMMVWIYEDAFGNKYVEDVEDVENVGDFEIINEVK